ncbi:hypothetical protein CAPTEDRAFT_204137, partial [Capitella teleta]
MKMIDPWTPRAQRVHPELTHKWVSVFAIVGLGKRLSLEDEESFYGVVRETDYVEMQTHGSLHMTTAWITLALLTGLSHGQLQEFNNMHALGGVREISGLSEAMCLSACQARSWCLALDFDFKDASCWLHGRSSACQALTPRPSTRHVKIVQCFPSMHRLSGTRHPEINDVTDCLSACTGSCVAVDFDSKDKSCWMHDSKTGCSALIPRKTSNHYSLKTCTS